MNPNDQVTHEFLKDKNKFLTKLKDSPYGFKILYANLLTHQLVLLSHLLIGSIFNADEMVTCAMLDRGFWSEECEVLGEYMFQRLLSNSGLPSGGYGLFASNDAMMVRSVFLVSVGFQWDAGFLSEDGGRGIRVSHDGVIHAFSDRNFSDEELQYLKNWENG